MENFPNSQNVPKKSGKLPKFLERFGTFLEFFIFFYVNCSQSDFELNQIIQNDYEANHSNNSEANCSDKS